MNKVNARNWVSLGSDEVKCVLCPHNCRIGPGKSGICGVRYNMNGELIARAYGIYPAIHVDPIEKKPLNHFLPGSMILSAGSVGCNLTCLHCQNWTLARDSPEGKDGYYIPPGKMAKLALKGDSIGAAFTYNEPTINHEYLMDACPDIRSLGGKVVMVTNGYLSKKPWKELMEVTDGANIDVKGFSQDFYKKITGGSLGPVKDNVKEAVDMGVHVEIAYLVIPGLNDDGSGIQSFIDWVIEYLDDQVPVHFNRFHPDHKLNDIPPTSRKSLLSIRKKALGSGLKHVFVGNIAGKDLNSTFCPGCGKRLVLRDHFLSMPDGMMEKGKCPSCGTSIKGVW